MKTNKQIKINSNISNINVILFVDTNQITKKNIENCSWLGWPNRKGFNEDFITHVNLGDTITWMGLSTSSPNDIVNITKISYEGGSNLFGRNRLNSDKGDPKKVIGTIINLPKKDSEETYTLHFTIYNGNNGGKRKGTFHIDPKIMGDN